MKINSYPISGLALAISLFLSACQIPIDCVKGDGDAVEEVLDLNSFDKIHLKNSCIVHLSKGEEQKVVVRGPQNLIDLLQTDVQNDTWSIKFEKCIRDMEHFEIDITLPTLSEASIYGSGDIIGNDESFIIKNLDLNIYGSGDIKLMANVKNVNSTIRGSGDIELTGTAVKHTVSIAGSGDVKASGLQSEQAEVDIKGSGDVRVNCSRELTVNIMGSGDVYYEGEPSIQQDIKGSGEVKKLN